jgi:hypothetical protein
MRYRNPDPMEKRQAEELKKQLIMLIHEAIDERAKKAGYRPDSILGRELRQDVLHALARILRVQSLQINFSDTGIHELNQYDTRNRNEK